MSAQPKYKEENYYSEKTDSAKKVNLKRLSRQNEKRGKKKKKNNLILSAAVSAVAVFGIILTL